MADYYVLYNPLAGNGQWYKMKNKFLEAFIEDNLTFVDVTQWNDETFAEYIGRLDENAEIVITGGDGTLNKFINCIDCDNLKQKIFVYPTGNGNDFFGDLIAHSNEYFPTVAINKNSCMLQINRLIKNLPTVEVNGMTYKFVNGVGFGIDGYCCEEGDKVRAKGRKPNYSSIAVKGLLFKYKPRNATVIVDGMTHSYQKVWIAPTMLGTCYGGGMFPTPEQRRFSGVLSLCVMYGKGKIPTLFTFPKLFKGEHVQKAEMVNLFTGKEITVYFDEPCALQIDGETIPNVSSYTARISS